MISPLKLSGSSLALALNEDGRIAITRGGRALWASSEHCLPQFTVADRDGEPRFLLLSDAADVSVSDFAEGSFRGHAVRLSGYSDTDVVFELVLALDGANDELLVQIAQVGGRDPVTSVNHFYRFEKPVADGGYVVAPWGSGYLIPADCPDELPGQGSSEGWVGAQWSLPLFGVVREDDEGLCVIVDTWWDCEAGVYHTPDDHSAFDLRWVGSLGKLGYPRRFVLRCGPGLDYVGMAKLYRERARREGLFRTLDEKARKLPAAGEYANRVLLRRGWEFDEKTGTLDGGARALEDVRKLKDRGLEVSFFFPKWPAYNYTPDQDLAEFLAKSGGLWQSLLVDVPLPGGWPALIEYVEKLRALGCPVQTFDCHFFQDPLAPAADESLRVVDAQGCRQGEGETEWFSWGWVSSYRAGERMSRELKHLQDQGCKFDLLYVDTASAHDSPPEDWSPLHPQTRCQVFEEQMLIFEEVERYGIVPGAELARFWSVGACAFFFFSGDWSSDRLTNVPSQESKGPVGQLVPLFQLVFHECYAAGFSGGGYGGGYDWWADCNPRLYELMTACLPGWVYLPTGSAHGCVPIDDWDSPQAQARFDWLRKWRAYYCQVARSEMVAHRLLSKDWKQHRVEFANGVVADFDLAKNCYRVTGVEGFSGDWEPAPDLG